MTRPRAIIALIALALALPSAAFGQGAGDEQYQDPFGDEQAQGGGNGGNGSAAQDDGLNDTPPVDDGGDTQTTPPAEEEPPAEEAPAEEATPGTLPNTGSDPRLLAYAGLLLLLVGVGLRLRTIDPDAY